MTSQKDTPFLFGAQYYRAPTPEPECWEGDLRRMRELGFNAVKYWVQWRWSHRLNDIFVFDDLDRLMDLALANGLKVTLNTIFDVSPHWLFDKYPDAKQVMNNGQIVEPYTVAHRQIGGHPGPCYTHPGARLERQKFLAAAVDHLAPHPALAMWDVWNEPEICFPQRQAAVPTLVCYCTHCQNAFLRWLQERYPSLERLNQVWGRCYETWEQVELPRNPHTINDFIDWREFHISVMTGEAAWRLALVKERDPGRVHYLHVVPNTMTVWNSVSCATDDFELAGLCDVFAASMNTLPAVATQVLSTAPGKICYNVESHINFGMTHMHQRMLDLPALLRDFLPQIGLGIKGFLFWQYRPEVLGFEAPAWGLVAPDGSDRPITRAVAEFWRKLAPIADDLFQANPLPAEVGIWKSRKNEIFHFSIHANFDALVAGVEAYVQGCYGHNLRFRYIDSVMLAHGRLEGIKLLVMPSPYYLTQAEANALRDWVAGGGTLLCESHLAAYDADRGRHSRSVPCAGLAQAFGLREVDSTSSFHLKLEQAEAYRGAASEDVKKALAAAGTSGGLYFPIRLRSGSTAWGAARYAVLEGSDLALEGTFDGVTPCLASKTVGRGLIFYCGSDLGQGSRHDPRGFNELLLKAAAAAGCQATCGAVGTQVHVDALFGPAGKPSYLVLHNPTDQPQHVALSLQGRLRGMFSAEEKTLEPGIPFTLPPGFIDLLEFTPGG
jgi:beta-galactosidase